MITRLTETWQAEQRTFAACDLSQVDYVYLWADGIHVNIRLAEQAVPAGDDRGPADGREERLCAARENLGPPTPGITNGRDAALLATCHHVPFHKKCSCSTTDPRDFRIHTPGQPRESTPRINVNTEAADGATGNEIGEKSGTCPRRMTLMP